MSNKNKLVIANWKMNLNKTSVADLAFKLGSDLSISESVKVVVCPSFIWLGTVINTLADTGLDVGSQNICEFDIGAYTGEVSAQMVSDIGCKYSIIGHSERRHIYKERDEVVIRKTELALKYGLIPIVCVGESLEQRESNISEDIITNQLFMLKNVFDKIIIAYEPVWAIGTGHSATTEQVYQMHHFINDYVLKNSQATPPILYGGSVNSKNSLELSKINSVDGFLVGGASLKFDDFQEIVNVY